MNDQKSFKRSIEHQRPRITSNGFISHLLPLSLFRTETRARLLALFPLHL
jgi:hypothetical protein